jgi:nucleoside-diphosphate-sugar epimerase
MQKGSVLVTGAAGVMGSLLVRGFIEKGFNVRGLVLPGDPMRARLDAMGCETCEGDVSLPASLGNMCQGIDTVFHLAAVIISHDPSVFRRVNLEGTAHMVDCASAAHVRHFVYVSSASVTYPRRTPYAESKLAAEQIVRGTHALEHTIVRPTLAYDESGGLEVRMFLEYLQRFPVVPFIGTGRAIKRPVWTGDIIDGLLRLAGNPVSYGKTYNFSGAEPIAIADLARLMLRHHGGEKPFLPIPVPLCRAMALLLGLVMKRPPLTTNAIAGIIHDADLDPADATRDLGYRPVGVREGFQRCFPIAQPPRRAPYHSSAAEPALHREGSIQ